MNEHPRYEVVVVGGGPAGLTTALYTTRLGHRTAVFDKGGGRHAAVVGVHNQLGISEDISGWQLSELATRQLEEYGGDFYQTGVETIERGVDADDRFRVEAAKATVEADRVVFATGFTDDDPPIPELRRFTGRGLHYCLHCDAYTLGDEPVFVLGHDEHAARVAMILLNFTDDVDLLLDGQSPRWDAATDRQLRAHPVDRVDTEVTSAFPSDENATDPWLGGLTFADGTDRDYLGGFAVYGKEYNTALAESLGCELADDGAIVVDDDQATSVEGVYAVGDVTHGQNQTSIAVGDGARAGMALHKNLRRYPIAPDELDAAPPADELDVPAVPADLRARMRRVRQLDVHAGLRDPAPERPEEH